MDSTRELRSGEKRVDGDGDAEAAAAPPPPAAAGGGPLMKKVKTGGAMEGLQGNMKEVAEMVLLLAGMGKMRGGRPPSQVELDVMSTAREKLAQICQCFSPNDLFPGEVFGTIIEDLGLDRIDEQRQQLFRPPKVTIAEKFMLSKRQMEKTEELSQFPATSGSQRLSTNSGVAVEYHGSPHKSNHNLIASGNFHTASPLGHATNSSSLPYQLPTSEVRPVSSTGLPSNYLGNDSTPVSVQRTDRSRFDRRSNDPSHVLQVNKGGKAANAMSGVSIPTKAQSSSGNIRKLQPHSQVINPIQAANLRNSHAEIGNIVLRFLQPPSSDLPVWTPPSRDYMNQPLPCQICTSTVKDVDGVLVCDTCEKCIHLKCLHINNARGIPNGDWHCGRCLQLSHGKPLPPKYGRVMRNMSASKLPMNTSSTQLNKKTDSLDQQKTLPNGNAELPSVRNVCAVTNPGHSNPDNHVLDKPPNDPCSEEGLSDNLMQDSSCDDRGTVPANTDATSNGRAEPERTLSDTLKSADWVSEMLKVDGNQIFYSSCSINGVVYKVHDHALIQISDDRTIPAKLQSMWEDSRTKIKWVAVNRCYFPADLPENIGRPCNIEKSEVYDSTSGFTVMADMIRGLCDVLPPSKFYVEKERRRSFGVESNSLRPLFFCKWMFDFSKRTFRDVSG